MSALTESLRQVMAIEGARAAVLVDIATGMVVQSAGHEEADLPAAAALIAEEAWAARTALGPDHLGGDLDEITLFTAGRLHMYRILAARPGEGLVLFVDLDRAQVNPALAAQRLSRVAPAILA